MTYEILPKNAKIFFCEKCAFNTSNKFNYLKHLDTRKHKLLTHTYKNLAENATLLHECLCGKKYKHRQSLYSHKKVCIQSAKVCENSVENSNVDFKELVCKMMTENNEIKNMLIKENQELRTQINELIPKALRKDIVTAEGVIDINTIDISQILALDKYDLKDSLFVFDNLYPDNRYLIKGEHTKLILGPDAEAIFFNNKALYSKLNKNVKLALLGRLDVNCFRGNYKKQIIIDDYFIK